jgi:hypothetical protein
MGKIGVARQNCHADTRTVGEALAGGVVRCSGLTHELSRIPRPVNTPPALMDIDASRASQTLSQRLAEDRTRAQGHRRVLSESTRHAPESLVSWVLW